MLELDQDKGREFGTLISIENLRVFVIPCNKVLKNKRLLDPACKDNSLFQRVCPGEVSSSF